LIDPGGKKRHPGSYTNRCGGTGDYLKKGLAVSSKALLLSKSGLSADSRQENDQFRLNGGYLSVVNKIEYAPILIDHLITPTTKSNIPLG